MTWERRLNRVVNDWATRKMSWRDNCAIFACDCALAVSGHDPIADIRDSIKSARGFAAVLRTGDGSLLSVVNKRMGDPVNTRLARRGDMVGVMSCGLALGVCMGSVALFLDDDGLIALPMSAVRYAWAVDRG